MDGCGFSVFFSKLFFFFFKLAGIQASHNRKMAQVAAADDASGGERTQLLQQVIDGVLRAVQ